MPPSSKGEKCTVSQSRFKLHEESDAKQVNRADVHSLGHANIFPYILFSNYSIASSFLAALKAVCKSAHCTFLVVNVFIYCEN